MLIPDVSTIESSLDLHHCHCPLLQELKPLKSDEFYKETFSNRISLWGTGNSGVQSKWSRRDSGRWFGDAIHGGWIVRKVNCQWITEACYEALHHSWNMIHRTQWGSIIFISWSQIKGYPGEIVWADVYTAELTYNLSILMCSSTMARAGAWQVHFLLTLL